MLTNNGEDPLIFTQTQYNPTQEPEELFETQIQPGVTFRQNLKDEQNNSPEIHFAEDELFEPDAENKNQNLSFMTLDDFDIFTPKKFSLEDNVNKKNYKTEKSEMNLKFGSNNSNFIEELNKSVYLDTDASDVDSDLDEDFEKFMDEQDQKFFQKQLDSSSSSDTSVDNFSQMNLSSQLSQKKKVEEEEVILTPPSIEKKIMFPSPNSIDSSPEFSISNQILPKFKPLEDRMKKLSYWGISDEIVQSYENNNIKELYEWQVACLHNPDVLKGDSLIYSGPTSGGKTLVFEILMLRRLKLFPTKKILYLVPLRSLMNEKMNYFEIVFGPHGIVISKHLGIGNNEFEDINIIVCTYEKGYSIINSQITQLEDFSMVIVDELHTIVNDDRGPTVESILTKLKYAKTPKTNIQIIGLSATLGNIDEISDWIGAHMFITDFKPIPLEEFYVKEIGKNDASYSPGIYVFSSTGKMKRKLKTSNEEKFVQKKVQVLFELCQEVHPKGVLVFCSSRNGCEERAKEFEKLMKQPEKNQMKSLLLLLSKLKASETGLDPELKKCILKGIAFHHAGISQKEKELIEEAFRDGTLSIITCTSTLASGVNLPAKRVILDGISKGRNKMDLMDYKQIAGRSGRKNYDTSGESYIVNFDGKNQKYIENLFDQKLLKAFSSLEKECSMQNVLVEMIGCGLVINKRDTINFIKTTLLCYQKGLDYSMGKAEIALEKLKSNLFILVENGKYSVTNLGKACFSSTMKTENAHDYQKELLMHRDDGIIQSSDLHIIILSIKENNQTKLIHRSNHSKYLELFRNFDSTSQRVAKKFGLDIRDLEMMQFQDLTELKSRRWARFFYGCALNEIILEIPINDVSQKYNIDRGTLQKLQETVSITSAILASFCKNLQWKNSSGQFEYLSERLSLGFDEKLKDIASIPSLQPHTARALYKEGYTHAQKIANADVKKIYEIIQKSISWTNNDPQMILDYVENLSHSIVNDAKLLVSEPSLTQIPSQYSQNSHSFKRIFSFTQSPKKQSTKKFKPEIKLIETGKGLNFDHYVVDSVELLNEFMTKIQKIKKSSVEFELSNEGKFKNQIISIAFSMEEKGKICCYQIDFNNFKTTNKFLILTLKQIFEDEGIIKVAFRIQEIIFNLLRLSINIKGTLIDPLIAHWLINLEEKSEECLKQVIDEITKMSLFDLKDLMTPHGTTCLKSVRVLKLSKDKLEELKLKKLLKAFEFEMKVVPSISQLEYNGMGIDVKSFKKIETEIVAKIDSLGQEILENHPKLEIPRNKATIRDVLRSYKEVKSYLYVTLKAPPTKDNSTKEQALETILKNTKDETIIHFCKTILKIKKFETIIRKFYSPYYAMEHRTFHPKLNSTRIHCTISQLHDTGRLQYSDLPLQTVPNFFIQGDYEIKPRSHFVAMKNYILLSADYKSIEFRVLADASEDKALIEYINDADSKKIDVFKKLASHFKNKPLSEVTPEERAEAKEFYAILYGKRDEEGSIEDLIGKRNFKFFLQRLFPTAMRLQEKMKTKVKESGYVETLFGKRRYISLKNRNDVRNNERKVLNSYNQGSAADIIKNATIHIHEELKFNPEYQILSGDEFMPMAMMVLQIHDELIFEVHEDYIKKIADLVKDKMENSTKLKVSTPVKIKVGPNWHDLKDVK